MWNLLRIKITSSFNINIHKKVQNAVHNSLKLEFAMTCIQFSMNLHTVLEIYTSNPRKLPRLCIRSKRISKIKSTIIRLWSCAA